MAGNRAARSWRSSLIAIGILLVLVIVAAGALIILTRSTTRHAAVPAFSLTSMSTGTGGTPRKVEENFQIALANHATGPVRLQWIELRYRHQPSVRFVSGQTNVWAISAAGAYHLLTKSQAAHIPIGKTITPGTALQVQGLARFSSLLLSKKALARDLPSITGVRMRFVQSGQATVLIVPQKAGA